jgi:putative ABC transport system permease protein
MWVDAGIQDLRFAIRTLLKNRVFTLVAVLTLALGIGANTAIFSLLNGLVFRDLSIDHPEQLVRVGAHSPGDPFTALSLPMFEELERGQKVFSGMFAWWGDAVLNVETDDVLSRADVWAVTGNFHSELNALPQLGRMLTPADVNLRSAPAQIAVLGYSFWQRRYSGRDVIGETIRIEGVPFTIVGVTRPGFTGMSAEGEPEVTVPLTAEPLFFDASADLEKRLNRRETLWIEAAGRLKSRFHLEQARAQLASLWPPILKQMAPTDRDPAGLAHFLALQLKVESGSRGSSFLRDQFSKPLYVLFAISGVVLLLTCVNLASLTLARAGSRAQEMGVRAALGASRSRLMRQMLTESVTLSIAGALAGFVLAIWGGSALAAFVTGQVFIVPAALNLSPDWRVLDFSIAIAIVTGVLFGFAPAWRAAREDPNRTVQQGGRSIAAGVGLLGKALIVAQVALSIVLLTGAGLFIRSILKLHEVEPGFRTHELLDASLFPVPGGYNKLAWDRYYHLLADRIQALPGVAAAGFVHIAPATVLPWTEKIAVNGRTSEEIQADVQMLTPGAFEALGIGLLRGRRFAWSDDDGAVKVAIVSNRLAAKLFAHGDAVGHTLNITTNPKWQNLRIVGVVSDASLYDLRRHEPPTMYLPSMQYGDYMGWSNLVVETKIPPMALADSIRKTVRALGHEYVPSVTTVEQNVDRSLYRERITAMLASFFGGLALLLAGVGLYGLMASNVIRRGREIAIRMALGAQRNAVQRSIVREAVVLALVGVCFGAPAGMVCAKLVSGMLYGVSPNDPFTLAFVSLTLLAVAALAAFIPGRKALRADPMLALRSE